MPIWSLGISKRFHIQVGDIEVPEHLASSTFYACSSCGYNFNGQIAAGELYLPLFLSPLLKWKLLFHYFHVILLVLPWNWH